MHKFITIIGAFFASLITRPLLENKISKFWIYGLNQFCGCLITVFLVFMLLSEKENKIIIYLPWFIIVSMLILYLSDIFPKGREHLKFWYKEPSEDDDREYFSKRDMKGKPRWKFMLIPGWITLIFSNSLLVLGIIIYFCNNDIYVLFVSFIFSLMTTPVIVYNALKRKRDYDKGYK